MSMSHAEEVMPHGGEGGAIEPGAHAHPGPRVYVIIGVILAIITGVELWVYNIELETVRRFLAAILLALSACKFAIVVGYYMHLRFDNRLFTAIFGFGLLVAGSIITALLFLFARVPLPIHQA